MKAAAKGAAPRDPRVEATVTSIKPGPPDSVASGSVRPESGHRRTYARYSVDLDVSVGSDHNFYGGFAENLSAGGIFVATHVIKTVGSVVEVSIHLPQATEPVRGVGEVRWIREYNEASDTPPGMGIRFTSLEEGSVALIESFLGEREPLFFDDE